MLAKPTAEYGIIHPMKDFIKNNALYGAFAVALAAMLGSLYFSEVLKFAPCVLCWSLRVATYPLVVTLGYGIYKKSRDLIMPSIILASAGLLVSIFHNLLYYKFIPETAAPCTVGVSCTSRYLHSLGFIDIPFLGLVGVVTILILLIIHWKATAPQK